MNWKPVVVGVDGSAASVRAAAAGELVARQADTSCTLVAAVPDYQRILQSQGLVLNAEGLAAVSAARDREAIESALRGDVADALLDGLVVRAGKPAQVLKTAAMENGAGLIVIGSRSHAGAARFRPRIAPYLVRSAGIPVLVTNGSATAVNRVLVGLDLSYASARTLEAGRRWARLFGAQLRALYVHQPLPPLTAPEGTVVFPEERLDERLAASAVWSDIAGPREEKVVRVGRPVATIRAEAEAWPADLLVIGSHGGGWVDRLLLGGTAEHLMDNPPLMTLVIPSGRPAGDEPLDIGALPWEATSPEIAVTAAPEPQPR